MGNSNEIRPIGRVLATEMTDDEMAMVGGAATYTQTCVTTQDGRIIRCTPAKYDD